VIRRPVLGFVISSDSRSSGKFRDAKRRQIPWKRLTAASENDGTFKRAQKIRKNESEIGAVQKKTVNVP
jgi:hypothetical protein